MTPAFRDFLATLGSANPPIPVWACAPVLATWREVEREALAAPDPRVWLDEDGAVVMGWPRAEVTHHPDGSREWWFGSDPFDSGTGPLTPEFFDALRRL